MHETDSEQNQSSEEEAPTVQVHFSQLVQSSNENAIRNVAVNGSQRYRNHCGCVVD